jgi:hypothetical protein
MNKAFRRTMISALAIGCLAPSAASADTANIGSALAKPFAANAICTLNCLSFQVSQVGGTGPLPLTAPGNGVVTEWKVRTGDEAALYSLRVMRPTGGGYLGAATITAPAAVPAGTVDSILAYPGNSTPIQKGDAIGIHLGGVPDQGLPQAFTVPADVIANNFTGRPTNGDTVPLGPDPNTQLLADANHELLIQATVKYCKTPNVVGQAQAAAEQAIVAADCTAKVVKQPLKLKKGKSKKAKKKNKAIRAQNGKVISQTPAPDTSAAGGSTEVEVTVGELQKKKKKKKKR